jgi:hypothetical protein
MTMARRQSANSTNDDARDVPEPQFKAAVLRLLNTPPQHKGAKNAGKKPSKFKVRRSS